jgi:etoposide-induced 2.4 mRNA
MFLNGAIFLGSIAVMHFCIRPLIHASARVLGLDGARHDRLTWLTDWAITLVFQLLWLAPVYCISFMLNCVWYQEIAELSFRIVCRRKAVACHDPAAMIRDEIYRLLLMCVLLAQINLISLIFAPVSRLAELVAWLFLSWMYAFYCFEYKWLLSGWTLQQRIDAFERHWIYFFGFGTPCSLACFFFPGFVSVGVFALIFPFFVITAIAARRPPASSFNRPFPERVAVFGVPIRVVNAVIAGPCQSCIRGKGED